MSLNEDFVNKVCEAFKKAVESASGVTLEGREREFRRVLARHLFDETLDWEGHSKIGEIYDITCFDDENFPVIDVETKWGVKPTPEIEEKLRRRIEELGSVKYGVFASERSLIIYEYINHRLNQVTEVNVAEAVGVAKGEYGLPEVGKKRILKLESLRRDRLVWTEKPEYFEKTYKEISLAKRDGLDLLTANLKGVVGDLTDVLIDFFESYWKRKNHYSSRFLESTFDEWLKISVKDEEFRKGDEKKRKGIIEIFCRETAYVLVGRLLFVRICEDKDISKQLISGKGLRESLEYFGKRDAENVYLHLFNESRHEIKKYYSHLHELGFFDWWVIEEVKKGTLLYDDEKNQMALDKNLDGNIRKSFRRLNRFDFSKVNRDILGDVYQGYLPSEERKRLGEFYTPKEVIEYILDAVGYRPENEIRGKLILDPSCGSGSFLVEALQRLIESYRIVGLSMKNPEDAEQIINECINSIYGLDIHPFASFITEMNMLFQFVDLFDVVRQKDKSYQLPRIRIHATDSLMPSKKPIELVDFFENSRRKVLVEETKGADKVKATKYDFVVGNPPYVRKERILPDYKDKLEKSFPDVSQGDADLYVYFIASGIKWLNQNGKLGYIVSNKFVKTRYGKKLRKYIPYLCAVEQFLDFGDTSVFKEATNYPAIIVLRRELEDARRTANMLKVVNVHKEMENARQLIDHIVANMAKQEYSDDNLDIFETSQGSLVENWNLVPRKELQLRNKIEGAANTRKLREFLKVTGGLETGRNEVYCFDSKEEALQKEIDVDLLKPLITGEDVRKWDVCYKGRMLLYVSEVDIEKYPNTKRHLEKFRAILDPLSEEGRKSVLMRKKKWFELRKPVSPAIFESEKLVTPDISTENNFAYDDNKYYCRETCFILTLSEQYQVEANEKKQRLKYFLGLLNSSLMEFCFRQISPFISGGYYRYRKQYLEQLPLMDTVAKNEKLANEICRAVDQILENVVQNRSLKERIDTFPVLYIKESSESQKLLDLVVSHLTKTCYNISEKKPRASYLKDLNGKEIFRVILADDEFVDFNSEVFASYVLELLKRKNEITKRELLELRLPHPTQLKSLLSVYSRDKQQLLENEKMIEKLGKQVDELVYRLYDMNNSEKRIVEDLLKKNKPSSKGNVTS